MSGLITLMKQCLYICKCTEKGLEKYTSLIMVTPKKRNKQVFVCFVGRDQKRYEEGLLFKILFLYLNLINVYHVNFEILKGIKKC